MGAAGVGSATAQRGVSSRVSVSRVIYMPVLRPVAGAAGHCLATRFLLPKRGTALVIALVIFPHTHTLYSWRSHANTHARKAPPAIMAGNHSLGWSPPSPPQPSPRWVTKSIIHS